MKKLDFSQMESLQGGVNDCSGQEQAFLLATAALTLASFVAGPIGVALALASFLTAADNLGNCANGTS